MLTIHQMTMYQPLNFPNFIDIEDCNWHDFIFDWDANSQILVLNTKEIKL